MAKARSRKPVEKVFAAEAEDRGAEGRDWSGMIGQDAALAQWRALADRDALPQVILLTGRAGLGKRLLLSALAAMFGCEDGTACGTCDSCRAAIRGSHPEILWIESDEPRYVLDDAARLQEHLSFSPEGKRGARVAVVVDADKLTLQAANRLLKTLEEPPPAARILLSTSRADAMIPTILSRCVRWRVTPPPPDVTLAWLRRTASAQGMTPPGADGLAMLLRQAALAPGIAWRLMTEPVDDEGPGGAGGRGPRLWTAEDVDAALRVADEAAARAGRGRGSGLSACLDEWEIDLNAFYREALLRGVGENARREAALGRALDPRAVRRRREVLREARALAGRAKIPLSAQLTAESLALASVRRST